MTQATIELVDSHDLAGRRSWDDLVLASPRGSYCQLTSWLASMGAYGFDFEVLVARSDRGEVIGGLASYRYATGPVRLLSSPLGPLVTEGHEDVAPALVDAFVERARARRCLFAQLQVPASASGRTRRLLDERDVPLIAPWTEGLLFRTGNVPNQLLTVDLLAEGGEGPASDDELLSRFRSRARRDVRSSLRSDLTIERPTDEEGIRLAFSLIEENGIEHGYATRSWSDLGPTIVAQVADGEAVIHLARQGDRPVAAHYGVIAGRRLTYMMGGTRRVVPDPRAGHFIHWHAMAHARALGLEGYDLTTYGNTGVRRFKEGFQPTLDPFVAPRHLVLNRPGTAIFLAGYEQLRARKAATARWARRLRSTRRGER